mmetsp:Transcript_21570/g.50283  ORF Transcript_21570/g.50283 Transcript_21570/m.50283 type:complete len:846 (-) Transcript_21570:36-2573(-)
MERSKQEARVVDLRYTKFKLSGADVHREKHAVLVPDHLMLPASVFIEVCAALGKEVPTLFLSGVSSMCHPGRMSTAPLRACADFEPLTHAAKCRVGAQGGSAGETKDSRAEVDLVNAILERKLVSAIAKVATAAHRSNVWTFSGPQVTNFEILLQQVLESKAAEADVFRMVAAHMQDRSYMESESSKALMKALFSSSTELGPDTIAGSQAVTLSGELWDPSLSGNPEFSEHGYDSWSFHSLDQSSCSGHPVTLWPWPHADLFLLFFREDTTGGAGEVDADWQYRTGKKLDLEPCSFNLEQVAPSGHVFIGEPICLQAHMKKKIIHAIKHSIPTVILDNTPSVAKQMSLLLNVMNRAWDKVALANCRPFLTDASAAALNPSSKADEIIHALSPSLILQHIEKAFESRGIDPAERLALGDVVGLLEVAKRQPRAFKQGALVLDPLQDEVEETASRLQLVLASHQTATAKEAPLLHQSLALRGWSLHVKLVNYAEGLDRISKGFVALLGTLGLLATAIALTACGLYLQGQDSNGGVVHLALLFLPLLIGLLMVAQRNMNLELKWACVHMTSNRVVSEIYHLLGNVGPYKLTPLGNQKKFSKRLEALMTNLSAMGVHDDEVSGRFTENIFEHDASGLETHINQSLYGISPPSWLALRMYALVNSCSVSAKGFPWTALLVSCPESKDFTATVTAESYVDMRVTPLRHHYGRWVRCLSRVRSLLRFLVLLCLATSTLVGVLRPWLPVPILVSMVPILLGLAMLMTTFAQQFAPEDLITVLHQALSELNLMELRWHGADPREKSSRETKEQLISLTEGASLMVARVFSQAALLGDVGLGEAEDKTEELELLS